MLNGKSNLRLSYQFPRKKTNSESGSSEWHYGSNETSEEDEDEVKVKN